MVLIQHPCMLTRGPFPVEGEGLRSVRLEVGRDLGEKPVIMNPFVAAPGLRTVLIIELEYRVLRRAEIQAKRCALIGAKLTNFGIRQVLTEIACLPSHNRRKGGDLRPEVCGGQSS